ncbi:DivIVA domain-containing protein [Saccharothrix sp. AJ9571]|nr:DivIVA domain-containing protein [Saccharothrix sp. AJ9571]
MTPDDARDARFSKPSFGKRGYDSGAVDALVTRIEQTLRGTDRLTAAEVREFSFGRAPAGQRGYREDDVDAFLDAAEAELRRREGSAHRAASPQFAPPLEGSRGRWWRRG